MIMVHDFASEGAQFLEAFVLWPQSLVRVDNIVFRIYFLDQPVCALAHFRRCSRVKVAASVHPLDSPFAGRQRHLAAGILFLILWHTQRLAKAELAGEVVKEGTGRAQLRALVGVLLVGTNVNVLGYADPLAEPPIIAGRGRFATIEFSDSLQVWKPRHQGHRHDSAARTGDDCRFADRERLEELGMGFLVWLWHHHDLLDHAVFDLSGRAELLCPFHWLPERPGLVRIRIFVVFPLEGERLVPPR